jgi:N-methylhydantoinase B
MKQETFDPVLLAVLGQRVEAITREVMAVMLRAGRSVMLNTIRDFSTSIMTGDCRLLAVAEGLPVHILNSHLAVKPLLEFFQGDIHPGDIFLNNCPYTGNSHFGDLTIATPVFYDDELLFWVVNRAHQPDLGAHIPTTYLPYASDIYQEGLHLPCVRVQHNYNEVKDIIRICMIKVRQSQMWYGDYLAQVGSVRIGERRLIELCDKYGKETVKQFIEKWFEYTSRRVSAEIHQLPRGTWAGECMLDPLDFAPNGINIKARVTVNPDEPAIIIDLTESPDQVPGGINSTEATAYAGAITPVLVCLDPTIPHNDACFQHFRVILREGCIAGIPRYPAGTSLATTYVFSGIVDAVMDALLKMDPTKAAAYAPRSDAAISVVSGVDYRRNNAPYVHQVFIGLNGGPASMGYDGWGGAFGAWAGAGCAYTESAELHELRYPHLWKRVELITDSAAPGKWRPGLSTRTILAHRKGTLTVASLGDAYVFPPSGVLGGKASKPAQSYVIDSATGKRVRELPMCGIETLKSGEWWECISCTGGGFGDPLERDPELVRRDARDELISIQSARDDYGVVLNTEPELYEVNYQATEKLRKELKERRQ